MTSGENHVTIRLPANYHLIVGLREGDNRVAWSPEWMDLVKLESIDGALTSGSDSMNESTGLWSFHVPAPGLYRLTIDKLPGYQEVSPVDFNIGGARTVERTIQLVRD